MEKKDIITEKEFTVDYSRAITFSKFKEINGDTITDEEYVLIDSLEVGQTAYISTHCGYADVFRAK